MKAFFSVAFLAVLGVWTVTLVLAGSNRKRPIAWAAIAFSAACLQGALNLLLAVRHQTIAGAESIQTPTGIQVSRFLTIFIAASAVIALWRSREHSQPADQIVFAVWGLTFVSVMSGLAADQPAFPRDLVLFAMVLHGIAVATADRNRLITWARSAARLFTSVSVASAVLVPGWAFLGQGQASYGLDGYDRLLFGLPRLTGLAPHPGALVMIATVGLLMEVGSKHLMGVDGHGDGRDRLYRLFGIATAVTCIVLAQSRTGWAAATISLLLLAYFRSHAFRTLIVSMLLVVGVGLAVRPSALLSAELGRGSENVSTVSGRTALWGYAASVYGDHPAIGYGPGFLNHEARRALPLRLRYVHAHNQVFQTAAETGTTGLLALAALVVAGVAGAWRIRWYDGGLGLALIVALCVFGFTDVPLRPVGIMMIPALVVFSYICVARLQFRHLALHDRNAVGRGTVGQLAVPARTVGP